MKKAGIIGSGIVGQVLANGFRKYGYDVMLGSNNPSKLDEIKAKLSDGVSTGSFNDAAQFGDIIVIAVKGDAAESVIGGISSLINGKVVIDATNPIAAAPPENGVLQFFTNINSESLMERLQAAVPGAKFVKAFNSIGNAYMVDPSFSEKPTMFICGNDADAKAEVTTICQTFGHDVVDVGMATSARTIEPLCILWCLPGFLRNEWSHAFRLERHV